MRKNIKVISIILFVSFGLTVGAFLIRSLNIKETPQTDNPNLYPKEAICGLKIVEFDEYSQLKDSGLNIGDVITSINGKDIHFESDGETPIPLLIKEMIGNKSKVTFGTENGIYTTQINNDERWGIRLENIECN